MVECRMVKFRFPLGVDGRLSRALNSLCVRR